MNSSVEVKETAQAAARPLFPFLDLGAQFRNISGEVMREVERVLNSQKFILGPEVQQLETEICELLGCQYAVGCASGSDALLLSLMALGIGPGDEVITTPFTFVATVGSILRLGAKPVFVDIEPDSYNLNANDIEAVITSRTKAVMPVHLFGLPAPMQEIMDIARSRQLPVIEDAAQAIGAAYQGRLAGNIGTLGCFSFFPSKNLGGAGDGGMVTTNDSNLADRLKVLRVHGSRKKYHYEILGINSRLDTLHAAILRAKLRHLEEWTSARRSHAEFYRMLFEQEGLANTIHLPVEPTGSYHVYNQFSIRCSKRDPLRQFLTQSGIPTEIYYPLPLHLQPAFAGLGYQLGDFPIAEAASREVLALPVFPEITEEQQRSVVSAIADFIHGRA